MDITDKAVSDYMMGLLPARDEVLAEMEALAAKENIPIIGPMVGRILYQMVRVSKARRIFEMGSAIGYSTIWAARAVGEGATVYYTDGDPENAKRADGFLRRAGVRERVEMMTGEALDLLDQVPGEFDIVFCDVEKHQYPDVFRKALPRIRKGGLLLADNALWYGRVTEPPEDDATRGILEFNRLIYSSNELFPTILPVRDGFAVCEKL
jgi:predicted O-methyltransferase YrrM